VGELSSSEYQATLEVADKAAGTHDTAVTTFTVVP